MNQVDNYEEQTYSDKRRFKWHWQSCGHGTAQAGGKNYFAGTGFQKVKIRCTGNYALSKTKRTIFKPVMHFE